MDYGVPEAAVRALSQFCRVAPKKIRMLDLRQRILDLTPGTLLALQHGGVLCPRYSSHRVGYGFCPSCIAVQQVIHVPWEWSVFCLSRCKFHQRPLLDRCPTCRESDPLLFTGSDSARNIICRSCGGDLRDSTDATPDMNGEGGIQAVEDAYRSALVGTAPLLLPRTTAAAFRLFFEEMLRLLMRSLNGGSGQQRGVGLFSRHEVLAMIAALVLNAAPDPNASVRSRRGVCSLCLWGSVVSVIPEYESEVIERTSIQWPRALRRRFLAALCHRTRKRWPHTPYRPASYSATAVQRVEIASIFSLSEVLRSAQTARGPGIWLRLAPNPRFRCHTPLSVRDLNVINRSRR
jgi:hypothetical protein